VFGVLFATGSDSVVAEGDSALYPERDPSCTSTRPAMQLPQVLRGHRRQDPAHMMTNGRVRKNKGQTRGNRLRCAGKSAEEKFEEALQHMELTRRPGQKK
jgi:hypothetical protein